MANVPVPTFRIGGTSGLVILLYVTALFGTLHLLAISKPDNKFAQAWIALGF